LLGTTKEWMILNKITCNNCIEYKKKKKCAVVGCENNQQTGCDGHCLAHATQELNDAHNEERREKRKKCAVEGCAKNPRTGCNGHCLSHATQEQRDAINDKRKKKSK
jgi:hypothetical protein